METDQKTSRQEELKQDHPHTESRDAWPAHVRVIRMVELGLLGVDREGLLYWDGQQIAVRKKITLSFWQGVGTILIVIFTIVGGLGAAAQGWAAAHQWSCQIKLTTWRCPQAAVIP